MKNIIIEKGEFNTQEALLLAFAISDKIEIKEGIISTKGFGSAIVKQNKNSVKIKLYRPLIENGNYITKILEKIINTYFRTL